MASMLQMMGACFGGGLITPGTPSVNQSYQKGTPYTPSSTDLIESIVGSVTTGALHGLEGTLATTDSLTDGVCAPMPRSNIVAIENNTNIDYQLDTTTHPAGFTVSEIGIYSVWADDGRSHINCDVYYSVVTDPTTFIFLYNISTTIASGGGDTYEYGQLVSSNSVLANSVAKVRFAFGTQENGYVGYNELDVIGSPT